jgi:hypothetical protein
MAGTADVGDRRDRIESKLFIDFSTAVPGRTLGSAS